jgi:hypothetical protein
VQGEYVALSEVLLMSKELLAYRKSSQKREREVFKAMRLACSWTDRRTMCHKDKEDGPCTKCSRRTCPLLKQKKEIK